MTVVWQQSIHRRARQTNQALVCCKAISLTGVVSDFVSDQVQFDRLGPLPSFILVFAF
jgi:hypothetical protein